MIAYFALGLSVFNLALWVVFGVAIRRLFNVLAPMLGAMGLIGGISAVQNLTAPPIFDKIVQPRTLPDAESDK